MAQQIPLEVFAVIQDRERQIIVGSGYYDDCVTKAKQLNDAYQSTAYVVERWRPNGQQVPTHRV